jgi:hypothetical protein
VVPPSLAEEMPLPPKLAGIPEPPSVSAATAPASEPPSSTQARPPAAEVAALRGRAVVLLERLLRSGQRLPALPPPARPQEFGGADGELLRLQDEVLALALEALRRPER